MTAPTSAARHSPLRRLSMALCNAVSDDEQAVSMARLGPHKSRANDTRLATDHGRPLGIAGCPACHRAGPSRG